MSYPDAGRGCQTQTLDLQIIPLIVSTPLFPFSPQSQQHLRNSNSWPLDDEASVLPLCNCLWPLVYCLFHIASRDAQSSHRLKPLDDEANGSTTAQSPLTISILLFPFSLQMPGVTAGLKPLTLYDKASILPLWYSLLPLFYYFFHFLSRCQE